MDNILVTGIGGNVGYGVLRNIRTAYKDIDIIGVNTERISPGNHFCEEVYAVPFSLDPDYIPAIKTICERHNIRLIIPTTDYETYILSLHQSQLPTVAVSAAEVCKTFLDKYLTCVALNKVGLPFAESILPSAYKGQFEQIMVKPREGRGSRNLFINPAAPNGFSDEYLIQPLLKGKEITTAFYVTKGGELLGHITLDRNLLSGATQSCEVTTAYDKELEVYITKLIENFSIKGSCNLQSIVTENGIMPFEINCRISGTNSIRSQFGFKDVSYTVDEYLLNKKPEPPVITQGAAIRILSDIIYPDIKLADINNSSDKFYLYE